MRRYDCLSKKGQILHDYITRSEQSGDIIRDLTGEELELYASIRSSVKSVNAFVTELIFIRKVIKAMEIYDLYVVANNFYRISHSMVLQRDLLTAAKCSLLRKQPNEDEIKSIKLLQKQINDRIKYLSAVCVSENIKLTPIQDYIDIVGDKNYLINIRNRFSRSMDVFKASNDENNLNDYVHEVMSELKKHGKAEAYKERIAEYKKTTDKKAEQSKKEKEKEKIDAIRNEADNGIILFKDLFAKGIRTMDGCQKIGMSQLGVRRELNNGARGKFCIIGCGFSKNHLFFRYINRQGNLNKVFSSLWFFETYDEGRHFLGEYQDKYPNMAFDIVAI